MKKIKEFFKNELIELKLLFRSVPSWVVALYAVSVVLMNLLANKEIKTGLDFLALDSGILLSWVAFLAMDMIVKRFGPKASIRVSIFALLVNLSMCLLFFAVSKINGNWGEFYTFEDENINIALNHTIGGSWFVVMGSSIAFIVSAIVNSVLHFLIAKLFKKDNLIAFSISSHVSTFIAQFIDNLLFALIVSCTLFGWTFLQSVVCALTGAIAELLCEVLFSWLGYRVCKKWKEEKVGQEYIDFLENKNIKEKEGE